MSHTMIHFEIPADDLEKMKAFYKNVFDWKYTEIPEMQYTTIQTVPTDDKGMLKEPGINGGIFKRTEKSQVPLNYVSVESVDEFIDRVVKNGGSVRSPKMYIPKVGDIAVIADPEGNSLGIIRPEM
ncbi:MAG: VOC family protein [Methanomassiliicoccus sp.]|nr:VOC family protein [Methanomassiliicoccus sp.]